MCDVRALTVGIDLDGVCYDFRSALRDYAMKYRGYSSLVDASAVAGWDFWTSWGWTEEEFFEVFADGVRAGFIFGAGEPMPGAVDALDELRRQGHRIVVVTHRNVPGVEQACVALTHDWLREWCFEYDDVVVTSNKVALGLDVLLDDGPHNIEAAKAAGERAIFWTQPWNLGVSHERVFTWEEFALLVDGIASGPEPFKLIGLVGNKRSGKDTAAGALIDAGWTRVALADPVREMALAINPIVDLNVGLRCSDLVDLVGWEGAKGESEVRRLLQVIGTDAVRRIIDDNIWITLADRVIDATPTNVVVTDVRFKNEAAWIKRRGGLVVRVVRPGQTVGLDLHPSEVELRDIIPDSIIFNDSTPEALGAKLVKLVT